MAAKKPTTKVAVKKTPAKATKPVAKPATFRPLPEATPRYVAPKFTPEPTLPAVRTTDDSWELALRLWWAQLWRTFLIVFPGTLLVQSVATILFIMGSGGEQLTESQAMILLAIVMVFSIALQVAVLRYMIRKRTFKGFTLDVKKR